MDGAERTKLELEKTLDVVWGIKFSEETTQIYTLLLRMQSYREIGYLPISTDFASTSTNIYQLGWAIYTHLQIIQSIYPC